MIFHIENLKRTSWGGVGVISTSLPVNQIFVLYLHTYNMKLTIGINFIQSKYKFGYKASSGAVL